MRITQSQHNQIKAAIAMKGLTITKFARQNKLDEVRFVRWLHGTGYTRTKHGEQFRFAVKQHLGIELTEG